MFGAILGDIIGSPYEGSRKWESDAPLFREECRFTDDTVLTIATAHAIMNGRKYATSYLEFAKKYADKGYGSAFKEWVNKGEIIPYESYGNGSAMRVSPVGWAFDKKEIVLQEAGYSSEITHNHPEGIKGAQAVALSIYLARNDYSKREIKNIIMQQFGYNLSQTIEEIRPTYKFSSSCQDTVPQSIISFLESEDIIDAIQIAISLNGDTDTMAAIAGSISEAYYGTQDIPDDSISKIKEMLPEELWIIVKKFRSIYMER